jgi:hypothetical protein
MMLPSVMLCIGLLSFLFFAALKATTAADEITSSNTMEAARLSLQSNEKIVLGGKKTTFASRILEVDSEKVLKGKKEDDEGQQQEIKISQNANIDKKNATITLISQDINEISESQNELVPENWQIESKAELDDVRQLKMLHKQDKAKMRQLIEIEDCLSAEGYNGHYNPKCHRTRR